MSVYFTSDLHLQHRNICKFRNFPGSTEEHDNLIIDNILSLSKRDVLITLGDFIFDGPLYDEYIERLSKARCTIKTVFGNHDSKKLYNEKIFETQLPLFSYKNMWISHAPIHPHEIRNRLGNIHGHIHGIENKYILGDKYFNVNIEMHNFKFVHLETIKEHFKSCKI